ncbi:MAG: DUF1192 domain-containing protein [Rhodospirillaceae bacterium]|nr:DUF1192 domain-containing protein [Rhodospirillaceae bacterium]
MDTDDLEPEKKKAERKDLEVMSIEALKDYIVELEAEIGRARAAIKAKEAAHGTAEDIFKK